MLSAIAARKAAKAAVEASSASSSKPPSPPPPSSPPEPIAMPEPYPVSKRKTRVSVHVEHSKHKKVKVVHPPAKYDRNVRYFDPGETSNAQSGPTFDEPASRIEISSDLDSSSEEDMEMEMDNSPPAGPSSVAAAETKRTWSPSRPVTDSSEDEGPDVPGSLDPTGYLALPASKKPEPFCLSTFRPDLNCNVYPVPKNQYATSGNAVILVLQPNETVALVGTYSLRVLQGSLTLLGVTLSSSDTKHTIFAPRSFPVPVLSWTTSDHRGTCTFPVPPAIRQQENTTAILIEHAHTGVEGLGRICKVFENAFKPPRESDTIPGADFPRLHIVNYSLKDTLPFVLPTSWEAALASVDEHLDSEISIAPVCLVKGPKKSGKSTLARTLVNRLLSRYRRVAFLECDLGQSEFTPGGLVALNLVENYVFGPPFTHPSLPYRAHYIGSTSPRASPSHYLLAIQSLWETYRLDLQFPVSTEKPSPHDQRVDDSIPLVINTMGWTKGLGADLNARIEEFIEASHTFEIDGLAEKGWPAPPHSQHIPKFLPFTHADVNRYVKVEGLRPELTNTYQTATDNRHLNILSYFHAIFPEPPIPTSLGSGLKQITATNWDTSLPLCARYPYEVDYTQAFDHVYLTGPECEDVVPSELSRALNGAIVGLVSAGPTTNPSRPVQSAFEETSLLPYTPAETPPAPALSMCHGLALIRGMPISPNPRPPHMHILTPLPTAVLSHTRVLIKGELELPIWGMLDFREDGEGRVAGVEKGQVPYLQWGKGEGIGSEKRRVRRNLMRKAQI